MWPSRAHIQLVHIVSIINGIYDPIGLASPMTIRLRVAFRNLFEADSTLPSGYSTLRKRSYNGDIWL